MRAIFDWKKHFPLLLCESDRPQCSFCFKLLQDKKQAKANQDPRQCRVLENLQKHHIAQANKLTALSQTLSHKAAYPQR